MPRKKSTSNLLKQIFQEYPGSDLIKYVKDGACLQATVDDEPYTLEKVGGVIEVRPGYTNSPDIVVKMNRESCEYIAAATEEKDLVDRITDCVNGEREGCQMSFKIKANPLRMLMRGYLDLARKLKII
ncbi:MAG: hypothetical protein PHO53_01655 [Actinomycetota bacterium]|nr:hypothetical protein [Actinomycetota bacterium]